MRARVGQGGGAAAVGARARGSLGAIAGKWNCDCGATSGRRTNRRNNSTGERAMAGPGGRFASTQAWSYILRLGGHGGEIHEAAASTSIPVVYNPPEPRILYLYSCSLASVVYVLVQSP